MPQPLDVAGAVFGLTELIQQNRREISRLQVANFERGRRSDAWSIGDGFMLTGDWRRGMKVVVDGQVLDAVLEWRADPKLSEKGKPALGIGEIKPSSAYADWWKNEFATNWLDPWNDRFAPRNWE